MQEEVLAGRWRMIRSEMDRRLAETRKQRELRRHEGA